MGRDGLVFVNVRKDMMKLKRKANLAEAPFMEHGKSTTIRWSHCSITGRPLDRPVFCELGKLYNKDSIIELLLDRKRAEKMAIDEESRKDKKKKKKVKKSKRKLFLKGNEIPTEIHRMAIHIRDLTDIKELRIKLNPHFRENTPYNQMSLGKSNGSNTEQGFTKHSKFQCPISESDFNGSKAFFGNWNCGHAITGAVLKELSKDKKILNCPVCHLAYNDIDLIRINPIHPDHLKAAKTQFQLKRKKRLMKKKLSKHYKEEMKLLKTREEGIKKEEVSSSDSDESTSSDDSSSDSSDSDSDNGPDIKTESSSKSSKNKRIRKKSIPKDDIKMGEEKGELLNNVPIEIDSDPILVQSSEEENSEEKEKEIRRKQKIKRYKEVEEHHKRQIKEFEEIIKGQKAEEDEEHREKSSNKALKKAFKKDCIVLSD